jgi:serine/threonine protein kinase
MPTAEAPAWETPKAQAQTPHVARIISSDSIPAGGFTPGTILADRYRVIGLLGRGGMGEVYRADDLKLGQPVALKFLPPKLAQDPVRRERFFAEVRITRQLSHPNICRVYDIGEIEGRHFLSMEFIDGEDLASLLKRIGYLSNEKALDIARQLAAGLAAAHERGVLHRDLKPANIMVDGHGRVRITDFGLAIAAEEATDAAEIAGTPAYMAPEQLAGKGATVRSDMYSLGLVLYEIYTGKKAFTATTLAELREQKETHTPRAISEIREGMDAIVERLIRRCMERDPNGRPTSVAQLAVALPGGDPLAAAIAAGETPSPELVAASGSKEGLRPAVAWGLLAFIIVGALAILAMKDRTMLHRRIPFEMPPDVLVARSREIIKKAGYTEKFTDSASGFVTNSDLLRHIENTDKTAKRWKNLDAKAVLFWYCQSPREIEVAYESGTLLRAIAGAASVYPPLQFSGEVLVTLDTEGHLVSFQTVPPQLQLSDGTKQVPDWTILFAEAGLNPAQWRPAAPRNPLFYADALAAWQGSLPNQPGTPAWIQAASFQGKPVSFEIIGPWIRAAQVQPIQGYAWLLYFAVVTGWGIFFARRNLRLGRGDRRNATRLALFILGLSVLNWILTAPGDSWTRLLFSPYIAGMVWILYIAIEPSVRRRWPQILVSWTRLLSGDWRDPLVARDVLVGCAFGILVPCIRHFAGYIVPSWVGYAEIAPLPGFIYKSIMGPRFFISAILDRMVEANLLSLALVCLLLILLILLRNQKAAIAACLLLLSSLNLFSNYPWYFPVALVVAIINLFALTRFGLVALVLVTFSYQTFARLSIGLDASAWYAGYGFAALAIFAAIVLYAFRYSLGGRPLLAPSSFDD